MPDLFFYGTLRHVPLLDIVLGQTFDASNLTVDVLPDHAVYAAVEGPFPVLVPESEAEAEGVLVRGLDTADIGRLTFYEAGFDFKLEPKRLKSGTEALVFAPSNQWTPGDVWRFAEWEAQWAALSCEAAREVMAQFGKASPDDIARAFPRIRARAQSRVNAGQSRHGERTLQGQVDVLQNKQVYSGFYAMHEVRLRHQAFKGGIGPVIDRGVFVASDAALVLPYDPETDRVLVVEQFRVGPLTRGDRTVWHMEPVAGLIDPGETPEETARREALEEAGLEMQALHAVSEGYSSPGGSTDFHYLYVGICELPQEGTRIGGVADEGEDIRAHVLPFDLVMSWAESQRISNGPLALAIYWLAHHRARLRSL